MHCGKQTDSTPSSTSSNFERMKDWRQENSYRDTKYLRVGCNAPTLTASTILGLCDTRSVYSGRVGTVQNPA